MYEPDGTFRSRRRPHGARVVTSTPPSTKQPRRRAGLVRSAVSVIGFRCFLSFLISAARDRCSNVVLAQDALENNTSLLDNSCLAIRGPRDFDF